MERVVFSNEEVRQDSPLLVFSVGPYHLCVPVVEAESVIEVPRITTLPCVPRSVAGSIFHREETVNVISMWCKFGLEEPKGRSSGHLIIAEISSGLTAFWVEKVHHIISPEGLHWRAAPRLNSAFDRYVIKDDKIILHTSFELIFQAPDANLLVGRLEALAEPADPEPLPYEESSEAVLPETEDQAGKAGEDDLREDQGEILCKTGTDRPRPAVAVASKLTERNAVGAVHGDWPVGGNQRKGIAGRTAGDTAGTSNPAGYRQGYHGVSSEQEPDLQPGPGTGKGQGNQRISLMVAGSIILLAALILLWVWLAPGQDRDRHGRDMTRVNKPVQQTRRQQPFKAVREDAGEVRPAAPARSSHPQLSAQKQHRPESRIKESITTSSNKPVPVREVHEVFRLETEEFTLTVERPEPGQESLPVYETAAADETRKIYIVVKGDTLWDISESMLGNPLLYPQLAEVSRIKDPDWIYPGDVIRLEMRKQEDPSFP